MILHLLIQNHENPLRPHRFHDVQSIVKPAVAENASCPTAPSLRPILPSPRRQTQHLAHISRLRTRQYLREQPDERETEMRSEKRARRKSNPIPSSCRHTYLKKSSRKETYSHGSWPYRPQLGYRTRVRGLIPRAGK